MKNIKFLTALVFMALLISFTPPVKAQLATANFVAFEQKGGVQVLFSDVDVSDADTSTFVDWTPINGATTLYYWGQFMDSINATITTDSTAICIMGYSTSLSVPTFMDTVYIVGKKTGTLSISATVIPEYVGFRSLGSTVNSRKCFFKILAPYNTGVDPADVRRRVYDGSYGTGN